MWERTREEDQKIILERVTGRGGRKRRNKKGKVTIKCRGHIISFSEGSLLKGRDTLSTPNPHYVPKEKKTSREPPKNPWPFKASGGDPKTGLGRCGQQQKNNQRGENITRIVQTIHPRTVVGDERGSGTTGILILSFIRQKEIFGDTFDGGKYIIKPGQFLYLGIDKLLQWKHGENGGQRNQYLSQ